ncbi:Gluconate transport-inducing protein [Coemansia spiralis]|uniref:Gluconate transport-inducing protein n=2 Tax=Coemansia TaxID=4863 RepID=A0A9W8GBQ0_9FUNG|nr:Gti1/Pac2 family-domain-containing protein [Coemansia spiralis]KAJ1993402.1 Gluconate transport-inducing protein [Coemansia umbellata]KAJ2623451.1 Gluconate transport-inducing protein [Coemansia sp. RSA 1358]KAJ2678979.1 Gluconate transport-inducing protein [Coemansia spiralis]
MADTRMETYYGFVSTSEDALALFEACRLGYKQRVPRRLSDAERGAIRSGSVFVWEEGESGMKRWTDGRSWSPSRVQGCFLTYHEWEGRRRAQRHPSYPTMAGFNLQMGIVPMGIARYGHFIGGPTKAGSTQVQYGFPKENGMLKKALSIRTTEGKKLHIIAYYSKEDHAKRRLLTPTSDPNFPKLAVPPNLYPEMTPESMYGASHAQSDEDREPGLAQPSYTRRQPSPLRIPGHDVEALSAGLHKTRVVSRPAEPYLYYPMSAPSHSRPTSSSFSETGPSASAPASTEMRPSRSSAAEPPLVSESALSRAHADAVGGRKDSTGSDGPRGRYLGLGSSGLGLGRSVRSATVLVRSPHEMLSPFDAPIQLADIRDAKEGPRRLPSISASLRSPPCGLGIFSRALPSPLPTPQQQSHRGFDDVQPARHVSASYRQAPYGRVQKLKAVRSVSFKQAEDIRQLGVLDQGLRLK